MASTLTASLEIEEIGPSRYRFPNPLPEGRGVIFGGHLLAQLSIAAAQVDKSKTIKSAQGIFAKTVQADQPREAVVQVLHTGRVLSSATASIWQGGTECARALVLLSQAEPDLLRHQSDMPDVPGPDDTPASGDGFDPDVRIVDGIDRGDPEVVLPPRLAVWVRFPGETTDQVTGQALVTHATARYLMGTTMLPHPGVGERMAHRSFSTGIVAHTVSFHEDVDVDRWLLVFQESTYTGRGRAYGIGQVFDQAGALLASFSQEAIMRHFPEGHSVEGREATVL
ncbi:MAG TPA: acyl-CoA thioesterase domain-containing protein [Acidimicrobiales bacterium]|nr:acyl-CoA thioesterase domain-containing protein [Acidimicrobiales bacterium]